jgi:hypothetical protein
MLDIPGMCRATGASQFAEIPSKMRERIATDKPVEDGAVWLSYICERVSEVQNEVCHFRDIIRWFDRETTYLVALSFPFHVGMVIVDTDISGPRGVMTFGVGAFTDRMNAFFACPDLVVRKNLKMIKEQTNPLFRAIGVIRQVFSEAMLSRLEGVVRLLAVLKLHDEKTWLLDELLKNPPMTNFDSQVLEPGMLTTSLVEDGLLSLSGTASTATGYPGSASQVSTKVAQMTHSQGKAIKDALDMKHLGILKHVMDGRFSKLSGPS